MKQLSNTQQSSAKFFDNQLATIKQVSEMTQVPIKTIRHWVYMRRIPYKKIGRHVRFDPSEIRDWINERTENVY
jgi:excisionase family DNA binding protein